MPFGVADTNSLNFGSSNLSPLTISGGVQSYAFQNSPFPWTSVSSAFFPQLQPNPNLWDKLAYYRLIVIDTFNGNKVVGGDEPQEINIEPLGNGTLAFIPMDSSWEFRLPITPQQLSITDQFAINLSATLRGVLEEHSGVRFKNISIKGTFGVWPGRPSIVPQPGTPGVLQSIFGNTIQAAQNVATQFTSVINNITTGSNAAKPINYRPDNTNPQEQLNGSDPEAEGFGTGYYQTIMLQQFLEQYEEGKRNPANAGWRLVFDIVKQNQSFVVTPINFNWEESVNHPLEIDYTLQLKAWRRINLNQEPGLNALQVTPLSPGILQKILNTISAAQNTAAAAYNLIGAVRSDVDSVLNIIRQTGILVKQLAGVALAVSDLPSQLVGDAKSTVSNFLATLNINNLTGNAATDSVTTQKLSQIQQLNQTNEGLSSSAVANGQLGNSATVSSTLNPSNNVFSSPLQYPMLMSQVPVNSLSLNNAQQNALQTELDTVNDFTVQDLQNMRNTILTLCTQLSNSFGAGNSYYSTLFNQPPPLVRTQPMTLDEFDILQTFYALVESYDLLTATNQLDNDQILNNMQYVNALAATSGIEFSISNSKIQVPVPFGLNVEQIAQRYLGDSQRWLEIVTLNELREPYIDENGFQYSLLSNANGRNIVIGASQDLFVGQTIYLNSSTQSPTARTILDIVPLSQTSFLLTLDGLSNLDNYTIADSAYIQAYLPGTVNSQNVIFVPSDLQTPAYDQISIPSSVANVNLVGLSKVDWLLDPSGDLATTNTGDFRLAAGITNLIQALNIKFGTQLGTSLTDPTFGLGVKPGTAVSDITASDIYKQIVNMVTADPRFSAVDGLQVTLNGPSLGINLLVQLAGIQGVFPVAFTLPTTN
jgi:hypothetical protein